MPEVSQVWSGVGCYRSVDGKHDLRVNEMDVAGGKYRAEHCSRCYWGRIIEISPPPPPVVQEDE